MLVQSYSVSVMQTSVQLVLFPPFLLQRVCWFCERHSPDPTGQPLHHTAPVSAGQSGPDEGLREI